MSENRKLLGKEVSKVNGGKVEICSRIKDGNKRMKYNGFERIIFYDLYNMDTQKQVAVPQV